jgi:hypothetical protein
MTENRLRMLLDDLAADGPPPDERQVDTAWRTARRTRATQMAVAVSAVTASIVAGTVLVNQPRASQPDEPQPVKSPTSVTTPSETADAPRALDGGEYLGVPVWWMPDANQDASLPWRESALPQQINLAAGHETLQAGEAVRAVFQVMHVETGELMRFVAVTTDGEFREVPTGQIELNRDEAGNSGGTLLLAPDGRHVAFLQPQSIELYATASTEWTTIPTADWMSEGARWLDAETLWVPQRLDANATGTTYRLDGTPISRGVDPEVRDIAITPQDSVGQRVVEGPGGSAAQYFFAAGPVPGGSPANPELIVTWIDGDRSALALSQNGRGKGCCQVAGWLDDQTLAFTTNGRLLAWEAGTGTLHRIAETTGLERGVEGAWGQWASDALAD